MVLTELPTVSLLSFAQPEKASPLMVLQAAGMVTSVSEAQPLNAAYGMAVSLSDRYTSFKFLHPSKDCTPSF